MNQNQFIILVCPNPECRINVRIPRGKGKIKVTCRKCKHSFLFNDYLTGYDFKKKRIPLLPLVLTGFICIILIIGIFFLEKNLVTENYIVKTNKEVKSILASVKDFDTILNKIENDTHLDNFTQITLIELAKNLKTYNSEFETRYPRYKEYRYMVSQFLQEDYSDWIGNVILGKIDIEFISNVFQYLSTLKDARYLKHALSRFNDFLLQSNEAGFVVNSNLDAFIIGSLALYCIQFPQEKTKILKTTFGEKIDQFMNLTNKVKEIPLNQMFIAFYLKYNTLESLITKKMDKFLASGDKSWDGISWYKTAVDNLINYFIEIGTGLSPNFYILFETGFKLFDPMRLYIALQVMKKIGFKDPELLDWLDKDYTMFENKLSIYSVNALGIKTNKRIIIFSDEITETHSLINGRQETYFPQILAKDIKNSALYRIDIPIVTVIDEIKNESLPNQYTEDFINTTITCWKSKHKLILNVTIISFLTIFVIILLFEKGAIFLTWLFFPVFNLLSFFILWNTQSDLNNLHISILLSFLLLLIIGIPFVIIIKKRKSFNRPGRVVWRILCIISAEICYLIKLMKKAQFYFKLAGCENRFYSKIYKDKS